MAFGYLFFTVCAADKRIFIGKYTRISTETKRAAFVYVLTLVGKKINYLVRGFGIEFSGICIFKTGNVSCKFYDGYLHTETYSEIRNVVYTAVICRYYLSLNSAVSEASRNYHA